ncbi:MAG: (d)CMP kinase [Deltaproteobacteria bacterium]|nr:(d)CMP kinase [Deltaproteobacteria bacterium]
MTRAKPVVTIDGPAGAGKTTLARALAKVLDYFYLESGALYRAVALAALERGLDQDDEAALAELVDRIKIELRPDQGGLKVWLNGREASQALRTEEVGQAASAISKLGQVRSRLNELQRRMGAGGGVVVEGRDAGTVVFPQAQVKFFLSASLEERARRRRLQLAEQGQEADLAEVMVHIEARDRQDQTRELAPLEPAPEAVIIDTTELSPDEVLTRMKDEIKKSLAKKSEARD